MSQCICYGVIAEPDCPVHGSEELRQQRIDTVKRDEVYGEFVCLACHQLITDIKRWLFCSDACQQRFRVGHGLG